VYSDERVANPSSPLLKNSMYRFVVDLLEPHTILSLLVGWALFRLWWKRREPNRRLLPLLLPLVALAVISLPIVVQLAVLTLECQYPPVEDRPDEAEAIVVFSGGVYAPDGPRHQPELDEDSLQRCLHAARLYAQGPSCPVLVSGGKVDPDTPGSSCAALMGEFLNQLGVKSSDLVLEEGSRSTYENAVESARMLKERGIRRVVLVVDAVDMPRAARCLRKQGIEVLPSPCHYRATSFKPSLFSIIPSPGAARGFQRVWHEWLGLVWYWCQGRI
jgi:uncharacterized SAM-binding protein YcdF (DUF218 family)